MRLSAAFDRSPSARDKQLARKCFEDALQANPQDSFTHHKLGLLLEEEFKDRDGARRSFEAAVQANPRNAPAFNSLGLSYKATDRDKALSYFQHSIAVNPEYGRAHKNMGLLYLHEFRDTVRARDCFRECLRVDPNNASAYVSLGQLCEQEKDLRGAEQCYLASIAADGRNPIGYFRLGVLKHARRDVVAARQQFELAVRAAPTDVKFLSKLAKFCETETREFLVARKCLRTALHYNPSETWIAGRIAYLEDNHVGDGEGKSVPAAADDALFEEELATPLASSIDFMSRQTSSAESADAPYKCPRNHPLVTISSKPLTYKPQATWACEECHKSIGGAELRIHGALHCAICKYDICSACFQKPKTAHVIPDEPLLIGSGGFGEVYREYDPVAERYVAVKYIRTPNHQRASEVQREVRLMRMFADSPHIVTVLKMEQRKGEARVFLELMSGSVAGFIDEHGPVHEATARRWIRDALHGLAVLHTAVRPVLHRDIKPENLLLSSDNTVKLSDFGLSKTSEASVTGNQTLYPKGTPMYIAPECYAAVPKWTYASDIWALGCAWVTMMTGRQPWDGVFEHGTRPESIAFRLVHEPELHPPPPAHASVACRALLLKMFAPDRRCRPTAEMLLADPYFLEAAQPDEELTEAFEARRVAVRSERAADTDASSGVILINSYGVTPSTPVTTDGGMFPAASVHTTVPRSRAMGCDDDDGETQPPTQPSTVVAARAGTRARPRGTPRRWLGLVVVVSTAITMVWSTAL